MADTASDRLDLLLTGKVALVTGGTKGIGHAIAERLLQAGATVIVCARSEPEAVPESNDRRAEFAACDVRKADQCKTLIDGIAERHGRLDILINNAGGAPFAEAATASPRFSEAIVALNLLAPLHMSQAANAVMAKQAEGGVIINIASVSGQRPSPGAAVYGAAKAGLLSLTASLAQEWGPRVRVNAIVVGLIETEKAEQVYGSVEAQREIAAMLPLQRMGRGIDVGNAVLFIASPFASFMSGAALELHGGGERPLYLDLIARYSTVALGKS